MSVYNTINVKDLPRLEEIIEGNFIIVENEFGSNILDFKDFVIGPDNASFYNSITLLSAYTVSLSSTADAKFVTSTAYVSSLSAIDARVTSLTANYPRYFEVYPNQITVNAGTIGGSTDFNSELSNIAINDINIVPTNSHAASALYFASLIQVLNPGSPPTPSPYTYTIRISTVNAPAGNATFNTKVQKYF